MVSNAFPKIDYASLERDLAERYGISPEDIYEALALEKREILEREVEEARNLSAPELAELRDIPLHIEIDLLPQDANALRLKLHQITFQGLIWQDEAARLSNLMYAVVTSRSPIEVVKEIHRQGPERARNNGDMIASFVQDFRLAMLCSPDQDGEALEMYYPEYRGRWRYVGPEEFPHNPGIESGGSPGNLEGVGGS